MQTIDVRAPYSFARTVSFAAAFAPCRNACVIRGTTLTSAVTLGGRAYAFTLRPEGTAVALDVYGEASTTAAVKEYARGWIGADDDVESLYAAADGDPAFMEVVQRLHGLHHMRFGTIADAVVYSILMQRTPMAVAAAMKRKLVERFGHPVRVDGVTLRAMPTLDELCEVETDEIAAAIGHRPKADRIVMAVRAVSAIGEAFLKRAPYEEARDALLEIKGVGPFAAAAILLRGLGRMDELPWMPQFERAAERVYGRRMRAEWVMSRYGRHIGYWAFYVMNGTGRGRPS